MMFWEFFILSNMKLRLFEITCLILWDKKFEKLKVAKTSTSWISLNVHNKFFSSYYANSKEERITSYNWETSNYFSEEALIFFRFNFC